MHHSLANNIIEPMQLKDLPYTTLKSIWQKNFKNDPPLKCSREFMLGHIAWHMQAKKYGGLSRKANSQLNRLAAQLRVGKNLTPANDLIIKSGTRLLREYKGAKHEVIVEEGAYRYLDKTYRSLSQIARHITGTQWNGKLFFGVKA